MDLGGVIGGGISAIGSLIAGDQSRRSADEASRRNYEAQREFAQHGIQWKVEDAVRAGLHPLAVLGASGAAFGPSFSVGDSSYSAQAGQDIGRAVGAAFSPGDRRRVNDTSAELAQLALERAKLQNRNLALEGDYLASRNRTLNQPGAGVPPTPVGAPTGQVHFSLPSEDDAMRFQGSAFGPLMYDVSRFINPVMDLAQPVLDRMYNNFQGAGPKGARLRRLRLMADPSDW